MTPLRIRAVIPLRAGRSTRVEPHEARMTSSVGRMIRRGCEACRGIDHGRHWGRKPVEPQQHTAKSNHQHGTIDSQPHRFTLGVILPRGHHRRAYPIGPLFRRRISRAELSKSETAAQLFVRTRRTPA